MAFTYQMSPTGRLFHESDKFCKMLLGPFGSGKSCACAVDVLTNACAQYVAPDGVRYCKVGVIRSTYPEVGTTTRRSLLEVLPPTCGDINAAGAPLKGQYLIPLPDKTKLNLEFELYGLSRPDDVEKIKSSNWTFAWINEATGICSELFDMVLTRVGRFPSLDLGGIRWGGVIMDFNMPAAQSWLDVLIKNMPDNYALFKQPPAAIEKEDEHGKKYYEVNPTAENLRNLGSPEEGDPTEFDTQDDYDAYLIRKGMRYYRNQIESLLRTGRIDVVQNQYCLQDVPIVDGKPVFSSFSRQRHISPTEIKPNLFQDVLVGIDTSGIHPAGVVLQYQNGKWCILDELFADGEGFENFLYGMLIPLLRSKYSTSPVVVGADPANQRDSWQALTPKQRLESAGIQTVTEFTNSPRVRIQMVEHMLNLDTGGLLVSPTCELTIRGFTNEYRYRRLRASGTIGVIYTPQPEKNDASHIMDALQYAALLIHKGASSGSQDNAVAFAQELSRKRHILRKAL